DLCGRPRRPVRRGPGDALEPPGETAVPRHADQRAPRTHPPGEHHLSLDPGGGDGGDRLDPRAVPAGPRRGARSAEVGHLRHRPAGGGVRGAGGGPGLRGRVERELAGHRGGHPGGGGAVPAGAPPHPGVHRPAVLPAEVRRSAHPRAVRRPASRGSRPGGPSRASDGRGRPDHATDRGLAVASERGARQMRTRTAAWLAWPIWLLVLAFVVVFNVYGAVHPGSDQTGNLANLVAYVAWVIAFSTVGALVAAKRPGNAIGW